MSDIETALRKAAKAGRLNHVSLAATWDGKFEAGYRGITSEQHRTVKHADPVAALIGALTGRTPTKTTSPKATVDEPKTDDNEDLL